MALTQPKRTLPLHPSLTRPVLLAGAERELVLVNVIMMTALILGVGWHPASVGTALLLATVGHWGLVQAAKVDPQLCRIYLRHLRYPAYWPAQGRVSAQPAWIWPSVPEAHHVA